jgi:hypothetical protein
LEVPEVSKTRGEAPSLPLCTTKNTCSNPVKLFSKQFLSAFVSHSLQDFEASGVATK